MMSAQPDPTTEKIKILIVEDSPTQAEALRYILEEEGSYGVTHANDGRKALELLSRHKPALVISDINMPEMNGHQLCQSIKADEDLWDVPVVLLTALSGVEDVLEGLACGADSFITKPYSAVYLLAHVERILSNKLSRPNEQESIKTEIAFEGTSHKITADPQQMLSLLLSTYEAAVYRNTELLHAQEALHLLNEQLEDIVEERTAELSAEIIERKRVEEEVRHRLSELEVLYSTSIAIGQLLQPKEVGQKIVKILAESLEWRHSAIHQYHPENDTIELLAFHQPDLENDGEPLEFEDKYKELVTQPKEGLTGWVIQHGEAIFCDEVSKDSRYIEMWPEIRSGMYVPLKVGERTIGCLGVEIDKPKGFSKTDKRLITTLAAQTASALENARLFETTQRNLRRLASLRAIDTAISSSLDISLTLGVLLKQVTEQLGVHAADVLILNQETNRFSFAAGHGFQTTALQHTTLNMGDGYAGRAALDRRTIIIPNLQDEGSTFLSSPQFPKESFVSLACTPLIAKGQVKGVLEVFNREPMKTDPEWLEFLETLAGQAAIAIDSIQLFDHLQRSNIDLTSAYHATIEGWSRALDLRDKETEGHTQRVSEITMRLAKEFGVSAEEIVHIQRGALLHDIGKMGIPDNILLKPGPLTDGEWEIMRRHPQTANELLSPIPYLQQALDIPFCHHEKWDGTGYPQGLKGEQIPFSARLFGVVDVWDALTSDRPYRSAWPTDKTLAYITEQAGKHFDPRVVEMFVRITQQGASEEKPTVLIVDDDEDLLQIISDGLADQYIVLTANSGESALAIMEHAEIAVILTDQIMPNMTGVQLLGQVLTIKPTVACILISGFINEEVLREAINLGNVRGFVSKPFEINDIRLKLAAVLKHT
jgi:response regulator RpfG family c-di-GMP phosphodiesterase/putative methionine-R-sulfoxide reductase with GAF domain